MNTHIKDLLLIESFNISELIETYREFFIAMIPGVFVIAAIVEYFDRLEPIALMRRVVIAILILTSIVHIYEKSITASMDAANVVLENQKFKNVLLMDMFDYTFYNPDAPSFKEFLKDQGSLSGILSFFKYHLFSKQINDLFTLFAYFFTGLFFLILKVTYSLVYYLGYALIGISCILYIFPTMGNVLRGSILGYVWCLVMPHVVAIIITINGSVINDGYQSGSVVGSSLVGTALLCVFSLSLVFSPLITAMILNGSGISQAGGIMAAVGANMVMNLPKNVFNTAATVATGGVLGPKAAMAAKAFRFAANSAAKMNPFSDKNKGDYNSANYYMGSKASSHNSTGSSFKSSQSKNSNRGQDNSKYSGKSSQANSSVNRSNSSSKNNVASYMGGSQNANGYMKEHINNLSTKEASHPYGKEFAALEKQSKVEIAKNGGISSKTNEVKNGDISNNRNSNIKYTKHHTNSRNNSSNRTNINISGRGSIPNKRPKK